MQECSWPAASLKCARSLGRRRQACRNVVAKRVGCGVSGMERGGRKNSRQDRQDRQEEPEIQILRLELWHRIPELRTLAILAILAREISGSRSSQRPIR